MNTISETPYKGYVIKIGYDESPESPREWDNLGTIAAWHRRYALADKKNEFDDADEFKEHVQANPNDLIYLPLHLYDHSGISLSTRSFRGRAQHAEWDSGQVGYIYVRRDAVLKEYGWKILTAKRRE